MVFITLTDPERQALKRLSRRAVGRVALRAQMVLLSDRGYGVAQIAQIHDCGGEVVRLWLHRYQTKGLAGLEDEARSGRPRKEPLAPQIVLTQASQSPRCSGQVYAGWTVGLLHAFLAQRFWVALSASSIRRYLKGAGFRWRRPRLAPACEQAAKADPEADRKQAALREALVQAGQGRLRVLFLDECDLHLLPVIRAMWMRGARVRVPTPGQNARRAFFGALDAVTGAWHCADADRKLAVHFVAFLEQLLQAYPTERLLLVLDNASTHHAKVVAHWLEKHPQVELLFLPRYSGHQFNPVERLWGLMKEKVAANRLAGSIEALTEAARRFFREEIGLHPVPLPEAA